MNANEKFVAATPADIIDQYREEAARVCDETARYMRKERGPLLDPIEHGDRAEFCDAAFGVAGEVAAAVGDALRAVGAKHDTVFPWTLAATLLRNGWKRGHKLKGMVVGKHKA